MKNQGYWIRRIISLVFCVFIIFFMGSHLVSFFNNPLQTVTAVLAKTTESLPVTGVVSRDESVFSLPPGFIELTASEGERVSAGQTLAISFQSESARQNSQNLAAKTEERDLLNYIAGFGGIASDRTMLDAEVRLRAASFLANASQGSTASLPRQAADIKALLFHQSNSNEGTAILLPRIQSLNEDISVLSGSLSGSSTALRAEEPGLFSALTDGLEYVWSPDAVRRISVSDFNSLNGLRSQPSDGLSGRLIQGWSWRLICLQPAYQAQTLGPEAFIRFSNGFSHRFTVEYVSPEDNGVCAVVLFSDSFINRVISERRMQGELILQEYEGVRIPWEGLRIDGDTHFVYCMLRGQVVRKDVTLYSELERDNYYLAEYHPWDRNALRPGDEIIIAGKDLSDGKVIK
jgi:hypothetical protein